MSSKGNIELTETTFKRRNKKASVFEGKNINALKTQYLGESENLKVVIPDGFINDIENNINALVAIQNGLVKNIKELALGNGNNTITSLQTTFNNFKSNINNANTVITKLTVLSTQKQDLIRTCASKTNIYYKIKNSIWI
jgi:hypothetical protein